MANLVVWLLMIGAVCAYWKLAVLAVAGWLGYRWMASRV